MSGSVPPAPVDLAALPAERRDTAWMEYCFRGDEPELTWRSGWARVWNWSSSYSSLELDEDSAEIPSAFRQTLTVFWPDEE